MNRFFLSPENFQAGQVVFPEEIARQICQVLRLRPGQNVLVLDNRGSAYLVLLELVENRRVCGQIQNQQPASGEPPCPLALYLCLAQREKFEWMLQKCTEAGATHFTPVISSRSLVQDKTDTLRKYERWERILREAAEQCGRGRIPQLEPVKTYKEALQAAQQQTIRLIPWEKEKSSQIGAMIPPEPPSAGFAVLIGPEGGFSDEEAEQAQKAGFCSVSLGPRILRMETAAIVATALVINKIEKY
jgi:16S rRNA (uracil1498-N3)-methyltransferase